MKAQLFLALLVCTGLSVVLATEIAVDAETAASQASLVESTTILEHAHDWLAANPSFLEVSATAGEPTVHSPIAKLTPYCHNIMKTWLHKCVFGTEEMPDALDITPECRRIYNINAKECMDSGIMTIDQTADWGPDQG